MTLNYKIVVLTAFTLIAVLVCPVSGTALTVDKRVDDTMLYTVQPGDTLWGLASRRDMDIELLANLNGMDSETKLIAGQTIKIPLSQLITHEVQQGETVWQIAQNYHVDCQAILRENEMTEPKELLAGQKLYIPIPPERVAISISPMRQSWQFGIWPVSGTVSSPFGPRDGKIHEGLDVAAEEGTEIYCVKDGVVDFAGAKGTYGNVVIIHHSDGLKTLYAHASEILVSEGERVSQGQAIARVGSTGRSTGPHLHFEVRVGEDKLDPVECLPVYSK